MTQHTKETFVKQCGPQLVKALIDVEAALAGCDEAQAACDESEDHIVDMLSNDQCPDEPMDEPEYNRLRLLYGKRRQGYFEYLQKKG